MASDAYINGSVWIGRTGNDKYGTFYNQCQPPLPERNLEYCTNPGFETNLTGWSSVGNHTGVRVLTSPHNGVACAEITASGAGDANNDFQFGIGSWSPGHKYVIECWTFGVSGNTTMWILPDGEPAQQFGIAAVWGFVTATFSNAKITSGVRFFLGGAGVFRIDDISIKSLQDYSYSIDNVWAGRVAENTTRVRGLSGIGTLEYPAYPSFATSIVTFPPNFFKFIPIVNVNILRQKELDVWRSDAGFGGETNPLILIPPKWLFPIDAIMMARFGKGEQYTAVTRNFLLPRAIGSTQFMVVNTDNLSANIREYFYWHAFGV